MVAGLVLVVVLVARWGLRTAPPPDWSASVDVDAHPEATRLAAAPLPAALWSWDLVEKVVLLAMITIIFAQVLPGTDATPLQITWTVALFVVANAAVTQWLASRGTEWRSISVEFVAMSVVNAGIVVLYIVLLRRSDQPIDEGAILFFTLLLTEIIILFDRYRPIRAGGFVRPGA